MPNYTRNMHQTATYWPPAGNDGFGGVEFGAPEARRCRWQDVAVQFRDASGNEATSSSVVYVSSAVEIGGYLFLGTSVETDPKSLPEAKEVRQIDKSPSLQNTQELHKAYL